MEVDQKSLTEDQPREVMQKAYVTYASAPDNKGFANKVNFVLKKHGALIQGFSYG